MKNHGKTKTALALITALTAFSSNAALVHADWKASGDNKVTTDTTTGLSWLKLNNSVGQSLNGILSQLSVGGAYEGWRVAIDTEVEGLLKAIIPALSFNEDATNYNGSGYRGYTSTWRTWMGTTRYVTSGPSSNGNRYWYSFGLYMGDTGTTEMTGTYYRDKNSYGDHTYYATIYDDYVGRAPDISYVDAGIFLVKGGTTPVNPGDQNNTQPPGDTNNTQPPVAEVSSFGAGVFSLLGMLAIAFRRKIKK